MAVDPGIFTLKTARDLYQKLERDFEVLQAQRTNADACFNFFVTAEHLPEWELGADAVAAAAFRRKHAILRVCSHIATGAKHFIPDPERHDSVVRTHEGTISSFDPATGEAPDRDMGSAASEFFLELDACDAQELGSPASPRVLEATGGQLDRSSSGRATAGDD
jgi:hypothetical protein